MSLVTPLAPGTTVHTGSAVIDFGSTPTDQASVDVTGQVGIKPTSRISLYFQPDTMSSNGPDAHITAANWLRLHTSVPIADTGFTITAMTRFGLWTGRYRVQWSWA